MRLRQQALSAIWLLLLPAFYMQKAALAATCDTVLSQDFNQYTYAQSYTQDMVMRDWPNTRGPYKMLGPSGSCTVKDGNIYGYYPRGLIQGYSTGFTWYVDLPKPYLEATMEYDVYFEPGFDWTYGGKLPGMCGYDCPVGCTETSPSRGWSTRLMWQRRGGMITYAYYPDKSKSIRCGENWQWNTGVVSGRWYHISIYNKMNTPGGVRDGITKAWLDGKLVLDKRDVQFRYDASDAFAITRAYITTYVGGSSVADFAPDHDQYIKFDNFKFYEGYCPGGKGGSSGGSAAPSYGSKPVAAPAPAPAPSSGCAAAFKQCAGQNWQGAKCCQNGMTCHWINTWYSQCS